MSRMIFASAVLLIGLPALASDDTPSSPTAPIIRRPSTLVSVRALANTPSPDIDQPDQPETRGTKDSVGEMAGAGKNDQKDSEDQPKRRDANERAKKDEPKPVQADRPKRGDADEFTRQPPRRRQNDFAPMPAGQAYQPLTGNPFYGGWGDSFYSGGISGYRSFRTSGNSFVRANSFFPFGFSIYTFFGPSSGFPTASISAPVTIMYDPAQVRSWSRVAGMPQPRDEKSSSGSR